MARSSCLASFGPKSKVSLLAAIAATAATSVCGGDGLTTVSASITEMPLRTLNYTEYTNSTETGERL